MTDNMFYTPYFQFLLSTTALKTMDSVEAVDLIFDFLKKWEIEIPKVSQGKVEIPTFIGSFPVANFNKRTELFDDLNIYLFNPNFLDVDLCQSLCFHSLRKTGRTGDILSLWEASVLNEPVLVYGASASYASNASLVIASLSFPWKLRQNLFPYLSISDPCFGKIPSSSIVGVSNPIVLNNSSHFKHVFTAGFDDEQNGLQGPKFRWDYLDQFENITSKSIRKILCVNTFHLVKAIKSEFRSVLDENPYFAINAKLNSERLERNIYCENIQMIRSSIDFSKRIIQTPFIKEFCMKMSKNEVLISALSKFSTSKYCSSFAENDIVDFYALINETMKKFQENESVSQIMKNHLHDIKLLLSPDLPTAL